MHYTFGCLENYTFAADESLVIDFGKILASYHTPQEGHNTVLAIAREIRDVDLWRLDVRGPDNYKNMLMIAMTMQSRPEKLTQE
jgi:hypothetical protein